MDGQFIPAKSGKGDWLLNILADINGLSIFLFPRGIYKQAE